MENKHYLSKTKPNFILLIFMTKPKFSNIKLIFFYFNKHKPDIDLVFTLQVCIIVLL